MLYSSCSILFSFVSIFLNLLNFVWLSLTHAVMHKFCACFKHSVVVHSLYIMKAAWIVVVILPTKSLLCGTSIMFSWLLHWLIRIIHQGIEISWDENITAVHLWDTQKTIFLCRYKKIGFEPSPNWDTANFYPLTYEGTKIPVCILFA